MMTVAATLMAGESGGGLECYEACEEDKSRPGDVRIAINRGYSGWPFLYENCMRLLKEKILKIEQFKRLVYKCPRYHEAN